MTMIKQKCDFCTRKAVYDGMLANGSFAYMCADHFKRYGNQEEGTYSRLEEPSMPATKRCSICSEVKPITDFYKYTDKSGVPRFRTECKTCNLAEKKKQSFK